ncbi:unnamed protein product, partial [Urochloa humidicola]
LFGEIRRQSKVRSATVRFNRNGSLVACQVAAKTADIYMVFDETEAIWKAKRRMHRKKEKALAKSIIVNGGCTDQLMLLIISVVFIMSKLVGKKRIRLYVYHGYFI